MDFLWKPYKLKLIGLHNWTLNPTLELNPSLRIAEYEEGPKISRQTENKEPELIASQACYNAEYVFLSEGSKKW